MAVLKVLNGDEPEKSLQLQGERTVLGRHPNCHVVLENAAVSRHHAQILESHGTFYLEDLRSRNGTFVNGQPVDGRLQLNDQDQIRICDVIVKFQLHNDSSISSTRVKTKPNPDEESHERPTRADVTIDDSRFYTLGANGAEAFTDEPLSSVISKFDPRRSRDEFATVRPEVKLRAITELTQALRRELELEKVLPKILTTLFSIFPQAEQGFILLRDDDPDRLRVMATRSRSDGATDKVAASMTIVRRVLETGQAILSENVLDDSRFRGSTSLSKLKIRSVMCVPLSDAENEPVGIIQIDTRDSQSSFTSEDLDLLAAVAAQAEMVLEKAQYHEERLRQREMERDLEFATQVQLGFLPKERPKVPGYAFADYYEAALRVGGDYFDYVQMPDGRLALALGDVAGKGMPAALLMARLYSSTRFQLFTQPDPAAALTGLNADVASSGLGHRFITFVLMVLEPSTGEVTLANAGHLAPLLRRRDGTVSSVAKSESGLPLGIIPDQQYRSVTITLERGDLLIAYTDGITEALNEAQELYGRERLKKCLSATRSDVSPTVKAIISDVESFTGDNMSKDDICCVAVKRLDE